MTQFLNRTVLAVSLSVAGFGLNPGRAEPPAGGVVFDFTEMPDLLNADLTLRVVFDGLKYEPAELRGTVSGGADGAVIYYTRMKTAGAEVERVGKTKVRVSGWKKDGKFHPAINGSAESKTIPADKLPKVTNPPKA